VRDATARYFRWRRSESPTRTLKTTRTELSGTSKHIAADDHLLDKLQCHLRCGCCRIENSTVYSHSQAIIGGKRFNPGESLRSGKRCGSVITMVRGGRSVYGLAKNFIRVLCDCPRTVDLVVVTWFPPPVYPDDDVLTVRIDLGGGDVNTIRRVDVIPLFDIQPSRVAVDIDTAHDCMYMMRLEGTDTRIIT